MLSFTQTLTLTQMQTDYKGLPGTWRYWNAVSLHLARFSSLPRATTPCHDHSSFEAIISYPQYMADFSIMKLTSDPSVRSETALVHAKIFVREME